MHMVVSLQNRSLLVVVMTLSVVSCSDEPERRHEQGVDSMHTIVQQPRSAVDEGNKRWSEPCAFDSIYSRGAADEDRGAESFALLLYWASERGDPDRSFLRRYVPGIERSIPQFASCRFEGRGATCLDDRFLYLAYYCVSKRSKPCYLLTIFDRDSILTDMEVFCAERGEIGIGITQTGGDTVIVGRWRIDPMNPDAMPEGFSSEIHRLIVDSSGRFVRVSAQSRATK